MKEKRAIGCHETATANGEQKKRGRRAFADDNGCTFELPVLHQRQDSERTEYAAARRIDVKDALALGREFEQGLDDIVFPFIDVADDRDLGRLFARALFGHEAVLQVKVLRFALAEYSPSAKRKASAF